MSAESPDKVADAIIAKLTEILADEGFDSKRYGKGWKRWAIHPMVEAARKGDATNVWFALGTLEGTIAKLQAENFALKAASRGCCYAGSTDPCPTHEKRSVH